MALSPMFQSPKKAVSLVGLLPFERLRFLTEERNRLRRVVNRKKAENKPENGAIISRWQREIITLNKAIREVRGLRKSLYLENCTAKDSHAVQFNSSGKVIAGRE